MTDFVYRAGVLCAEDVPLPDIAAAVGTPFYCYSSAVLIERYRALAAALKPSGGRICYAVKANSNLAVLETLAREGAGADIVSEGEMRRALAAGIPASRMVFSGVGKTEREIEFALEAGIHQINVESVPEIHRLSEVATSMGKTAPYAVRINPDVDADTHDKIATGRSGDKFGIAAADIADVLGEAAGLPGIELRGLAMHIGSQITRIEPYREAFSRLAEIVTALRADGIDIHALDLGGGIGIDYQGETPPSPEAYAALVDEIIGPLGCEIMVEPGRFIAGSAGIFVTQVQYIKDGPARRFVIVDGAMNDLLRPSLYDAVHGIDPVMEAAPNSPTETADVVGPVCETGDVLGYDRALPPLAEGDLLAVRSAGAYGAVMASTYNERPLTPEVLVRGADFAVVRRRQSYDEMQALESPAPWLTDTTTSKQRSG